MVNKIKEYWFGILLTCMVVVSIIFAVIVAVSPHNDLEMRGFAPCTVKMAEDLSENAANHDVWGIFVTITKTNICYAGIIRDGVGLWFSGKQTTPWANYIFEPLTFDVSPEESEPYSQDLLDANRFKDDDILFNVTVEKESDDDKIQE